MAKTIIEIKNLHKYFGKNEVLKGIDLDIKKGEVVVIICLLYTSFITLRCLQTWGNCSCLQP